MAPACGAPDASSPPADSAKATTDAKPTPLNTAHTSHGVAGEIGYQPTKPVKSIQAIANGNRAQAMLNLAKKSKASDTTAKTPRNTSCIPSEPSSNTSEPTKSAAATRPPIPLRIPPNTKNRTIIAIAATPRYFAPFRDSPPKSASHIPSASEAPSGSELIVCQPVARNVTEKITVKTKKMSLNLQESSKHF